MLLCVNGGASPYSSEVKNLPAMQEPQDMQIPSLGWEDPLEEGMATHSSILQCLENPTVGQKSLEGYSPWGCREMDRTEHTLTY